MIKKLFPLLISGLLLFSCNNPENIFSAARVVEKEPDIKYTDIKLEKLQLDSVYCSYTGVSSVDESGRIIYYDKYFNQVFTFDGNGKLIEKAIGKGRGPGETTIGQGADAVFSTSGDMALVGSTLDFDYFRRDMKTHEYFSMYASYDRNSTAPDNFDTYTYQWDNFVGRLRDDILYLAAVSDRDEYSYFTTPDDYLRQSFRIGRINLIKKENMPMLVKGFPELYIQHPDRYSSFQNTIFDISDNGGIYLGFESDSHLYECGKDGMPMSSFGLAGRDIQNDYIPGLGFEDSDYYLKNREEKGYYSWLEYIDETGILFRSYVRSANAPTDGLQVYSSDKTLIADVDVPKGFKVLGYIEPYYYSQVAEDAEHGKLSVYRFKL